MVLLLLIFHAPSALTVRQSLAFATAPLAPRCVLSSSVGFKRPACALHGAHSIFSATQQLGLMRAQRHTSNGLGLQMQQSEEKNEENPRKMVATSLDDMKVSNREGGRAWSPKEVSRRKFLSAALSIMIAVAGLSSSGPRSAFAGDFEPSDAKAESGLLIKMGDMRARCSDGWAPNWRETGRASICLEADGCLWRKKDLIPRPFEQPFKDAEATYNQPFVGYLSRFILNFDPRWQEWWVIRQKALRVDLNQAQVSAQLSKDLSKFAGSLQYGLSKYTTPEGVRRLAAELQLHYGDLGDEVNNQLATAFALLDGPNQPTEYIQDMARTIRDAKNFPEAKREELRQQAETVMKSPLSREGLPPLLTDQPLLRTRDSFALALTPEASENYFSANPVGPVTRERSLEAAIYGACAVSGLVCCGLMHVAVTPLDVVKTRMQTAPRRYKGLKDGLRRIWREEGLDGLFSGVGPTVLGYSWYGLAVYPAYELFKRSFIAMVGEANDAIYHVPLVLAAGACSTAIACLGVCPAEVVRIRTVSNPSFGGGTTFGVASKIVQEEGFFRGLYEGFSFLLTRQVLFGMVKFFVFDTFASSLFAAFPFLAEQAVTKLLVSLVAGAVAGVASTIVSQPADSVLTRMKDSKSVDAATVVLDIWNTMGPKGFFSGLASRCAWAGIIISGQFLLYDIGKNVLQITTDDLTLFLDVIGSIELGSTLSGLRG